MKLKKLINPSKPFLFLVQKMMEEDEFGARRPRSRNWNTAEKFFLFEHVKNRFDIITDPRKETASINAKRRVWEQIYQAIAKE